ncbi:Sodium:dicarboxylate symporter [Tepidanaerobacter acetatoxydans Re1]|uniref:Sodium:dicarboxylate symporter n=1 Tax=Tepidanaerobacter acetatoxydans (strain DSM 21804 / JCM 16047 / Re1) TaxID=1209989 RepID=F4LVE1_TEPAE|nr:dicarboxylate/amino acid:cation symporter [Tepidanaerobacter acetatoxydans]AEE90716.1 sodium:dicarboxylate symporter [Tepidanaerobacter acetatoxydans Re1]CCP25257.1 Sodium:dicarboxylate symporter [Tepidanaerobacter acetatoxydans Re1]
MSKYWKNLNLFTKIMIGFILGIVAGAILGPKASKLEFLGTILVRLLTMVVAPLVLSLLICAAADVGDYKSLGKIGIKTVIIFLVSTVASIILGLVLANMFNVGLGMNTNLTTDAKTVEIPSTLDTLINIIPKNPFQALTEMNLLQIIFFALFVGFAITKIGEKGDAVYKFFSSLKDVMTTITDIVLKFTPYGVFGLMAKVVGTNGLGILIPYTKTIIAMYLGSIICMFLIQGVIMVGMLGKTNVFEYFKAMKEAAMFAFATCSSVATIPLTLDGAKKLGINEKVSNFVIPLGAVVNMNGTAIYSAIAVVFTAQVYGIELTFMQQLMVLFAGTLAAIGTAGVPGSGLVMLTIVLSAVNLPLEGIGLLAGIDRILNMARVVPNIMGDAAAAVIVSNSKDLLNEENISKIATE